MARQPLPKNARCLGRLDDGTPYFAPLGKIPYDPDEDRVQCHLCGGWYKVVGSTHLIKVHGWTITEYRERLGLLSKDKTCARGVSRRLRSLARERRATGMLYTEPDRANVWHPGRRTPYGKSLAALRPDLVAELDREHNDPALDVSRIAAKSGKKLWWRCPDCQHVWQAAPHQRSRGRGACPQCAYERRAAANRHAAAKQRAASKRAISDVRPDLATELHPTRNPGLDPSALAPYTKQKAWWLCATCGHEWQAEVASRVRGTGCPECARHNLSVRKSHVPYERSLACKRPEIAAELHPTRNPDIDPRSLANQSNQLLWWLCSACGNSWRAKPCARREAAWCPTCRGSA